MRLGLGTVQFGLPYGITNKDGQVGPDEANRILQLAAKHGMQVLDTAAGYGNSETVLGQCLTKPHDFSIVTKTLPLRKDQIYPEDVAIVATAFEKSLSHLRQLSVHGLLVHHAADLLNPGGERLYESLLRWKEDGRVKKIGISVYDAVEVDRLFEKYVFDLVQLPLSIYDQRLVKDGTLQWLHAAGVEIHVRSAFLQGVLLMPTDALPEYFSSLKDHHSAYIEAMKLNGLSPLSGALGYFHQRPEVSTVLVGVQTWLQLQECLTAAKEISLPDFSCWAVNDPQMLDPRVWR